MPFERHYPRSSIPIPKPQSFDKMCELAEKISKGYSFMRIDFYEVEHQPYFGEITLYPGNGFEEFNELEWDYKLGSWITLPVKTENCQ